jgi:hypothetical protein
MVTISKAGWRFWGVALMLLGLCPGAIGAGVQPPPSGGQQVTFGWLASPDPTVVGYYLYYGTTSGIYTNKINVGTNTTYTSSGLVAGSNYYFNCTSYNAANIESSYVQEIPYVVPGILALTQNPASGAMRVQFPVASAQSYTLQASSDLQSWSNLWLTPTQTTNGWIEYDEPMTNTVSGRFYRLILN